MKTYISSYMGWPHRTELAAVSVIPVALVIGFCDQASDVTPPR